MSSMEMGNDTNFTNYADYGYEDYPLYNDTDYPMYEEGEVPSPAMSEVLVPVLVYSATYITGLLGNILILVAVTGQKQVRLQSTTSCLHVQNGIAESRYI